MSARLDIAGRVQRGTLQGTFTWPVPVADLLETTRIESNTFAVGGFKWRTAFLRGGSSLSDHDAKFVLYSCNPVGVRVNVTLRVKDEDGDDILPSENYMKSASPFNLVCRTPFSFERLVGNTASNELAPLAHTLLAQVDFKDTTIASEEEWNMADEDSRAQNNDSRRIKVELITKNSIQQQLKTPTIGMIVPNIPPRSTDVWSCSLVRLWANQSDDFRYWLCERRPDGSVIVKRCLDEADTSEFFGGICDENAKGGPSITMFREQKRSMDNFQQITENTIIIYCMLFEQRYQEPSYLGYLLIDRNTPSHRVAGRVADDMARLRDDQNYKVFLRRENWQEITGKRSTLKEFEVQSGTILVIEPAKHNAESAFAAFVYRTAELFQVEAKKSEAIGRRNTKVVSEDVPCPKGLDVRNIKKLPAPHKQTPVSPGRNYPRDLDVPASGKEPPARGQPVPKKEGSKDPESSESTVKEEDSGSVRENATHDWELSQSQRLAATQEIRKFEEESQKLRNKERTVWRAESFPDSSGCRANHEFHQLCRNPWTTLQASFSCEVRMDISSQDVLPDSKSGKESRRDMTDPALDSYGAAMQLKTAAQAKWSDRYHLSNNLIEALAKQCLIDTPDLDNKKYTQAGVELNTPSRRTSVSSEVETKASGNSFVMLGADDGESNPNQPTLHPEQSEQDCGRFKDSGSCYSDA